jgi:hypothetical protein
VSRIGEWLLNNIVSLFAALISLIAIGLTLWQQSQKNEVVSDRLYFGSYTIGQKFQDIKESLRGKSPNDPRAAAIMNQQLKKYVAPIEFSLGIQSALEDLTLNDLLNSKDTDPNSPGSLYFDAAAAKYDDRKVIDVFDIGQIDAELTYAYDHKLLNSWWPSLAGEMNLFLLDAGFNCGVLDVHANPNSFASLTQLNECLSEGWGVSASAPPSPKAT